MNEKLVVETKPAVESKTHWFNAIVGPIALMLPPPWNTVAIAVQTIGNLIIRQWFTAAPIKGII